MMGVCVLTRSGMKAGDAMSYLYLVGVVILGGILYLVISCNPDDYLQAPIDMAPTWRRRCSDGEHLAVVQREGWPRG